MSKSPFSGLLTLFIIFIFIFCGSIFALGMYSEHAQAVDINNTSSASMYNSTMAERNVTFSLWPVIAMVLGITLLVYTIYSWRHF